MEKIIKTCEKCKTVLKKIDVCDVCNKELDGYTISIWEDIERRWPEDDEYGFNYDVCSIEYAIKLLKKEHSNKD